MATVIDQTLGDFAQSAIAKYLKQATQYEKGVLADVDPEDLHQMRVGMRRLRTAMQVLTAGIKLPKAGREAKVAEVARQLGQLRDLDVIGETLRQQYLPDLPEAEQKELAIALAELTTQRTKTFKQVKTVLLGRRYQKLKDSLKSWLKTPDYRAIAPLPLAIAIPDLVLPLISGLWLHPGWLIGTQIPLQVSTELSAAEADALIQNQGALLHSLRKQIKRVRYQLKLVSPLYGGALDWDLENFGTMQDTLGHLQDSTVLAEFLNQAIPGVQERMPTLFALLADSRHRAWKQWQTLQTIYLDPNTRHRIRFTLLSLAGSPTAPHPEALVVDHSPDKTATPSDPSPGLASEPSPTEPSLELSPEQNGASSGSIPAEVTTEVTPNAAKSASPPVQRKAAAKTARSPRASTARTKRAPRSSRTKPPQESQE